MVYHYTNFIWETNAWWLRRVRPLWMSAFGIYVLWVGYRFVFFGKIQAYWQKYHGEEEMKRRAEENKRNWGYDSSYKPTLERSRKKMIMEALGVNYRPADPWSERFMYDTRTLEEIMEEEENWE